jgi:hypothetical protein
VVPVCSQGTSTGANENFAPNIRERERGKRNGWMILDAGPEDMRGWADGVIRTTDKYLRDLQQAR